MEKFAGAFANPGFAHKNRAPTFVGLGIALFALPLFMATYRAISGENQSNWTVLGREFAVFALVGAHLAPCKSHCDQFDSIHRVTASQQQLTAAPVSLNRL